MNCNSSEESLKFVKNYTLVPSSVQIIMLSSDFIKTNWNYLFALVAPRSSVKAPASKLPKERGPPIQVKETIRLIN